MSRCIHPCGKCENNVTCPYFCDKPQRYRAYGSIAEMERDIERKKDERLKALTDSSIDFSGKRLKDTNVLEKYWGKGR